jgi:hypothetical protein
MSSGSERQQRHRGASSTLAGQHSVLMEDSDSSGDEELDGIGVSKKAALAYLRGVRYVLLCDIFSGTTLSLNPFPLQFPYISAIPLS